MERNRLGRWYDGHLGRLLPSDRLLGVLFCAGLNCVVYWGTQRLTEGRDLMDMTTAPDRMLPFAPMWSLVYVAAFGYWIVSYVVLARGEDWYSLMASAVLAKLCCGVCFLLLPTTMERPALDGAGLGAGLLKVIYTLDPPRDLFPSIHCLESWICFGGLRRRGDIPAWWKGISLGCCILICVSTLLIRQHVLMDVAGGLLLGVGALRLGRKASLGHLAGTWTLRLDRRIFGK